MQINNISGSSVANAVWSAASRSLTADPATDAGAATFVWTHATRTLTDPNAGNLNFETVTPLNVVSAAVQFSFGVYSQLIASLAHNVRAVLISVSAGTAKSSHIAFSTGGAGSEVDKSHYVLTAPPVNDVVTFEIKVDATLHAKGSRLAVHCANLTDATTLTLTMGVTTIEDNA